MKNYASLIEHLNSFKENRAEMIKSNLLLHPEQRKEYAEKIAKCFIPCAKKILAGYFKVTNDVGGKTLVRKIQPTVLELYYHEEKDGGFRDPIMYHTDYRKRTEKKAKGETYFSLTGLAELPYYPIGSLNPHTSGIDVTFENAQEKYRASFLIRAYSVTDENGKTRTVDNSTEIYDDLLLNGISLDNADWIEWVDGNEDAQLNEPERRRNVPDYERVPENPELWIRREASGKDTFSIGKYRYAKCPFNWQFSKK